MNPHDKYFAAQKVALAARSIPTVRRSGRRFSFVSFVMGMAFGAAVALGLEGALHQACPAVASDVAAAIGNEHWQLYRTLQDGPLWKL
jgi:hypothetical protein